MPFTLLPAGCRGEAGGKGRAVLVCGGAAVDCIVRPFDAEQRGASRTSLPGAARISLGGVGRNVAEVIARLGGKPSLLSMVGQDEPGEQLAMGCEGLGVATKALLRKAGGRTATYTALLDGSGELVGAVADMAILDEVPVDEALVALRQVRDDLGLVVCDGNLPSAVLAAVHAEAGVPAWFEPVSVAKAAKGLCGRPWHLMTPNWDELQSLLGQPAQALEVAGADWRPPGELLAALAAALDRRLAENVLVSMGPGGAVLASATVTGAAVADLVLDPSVILSGSPGAPSNIPPLHLRVEVLKEGYLWYRLLRPLSSVVDVTGAGDALLAGAARAFSAGWPLQRAVVAGLFCAHCTLFASGAVAAFLSEQAFARLAAAAGPGSRL